MTALYRSSWRKLTQKLILEEMQIAGAAHAAPLGMITEQFR